MCRLIHLRSCRHFSRSCATRSRKPPKAMQHGFVRLFAITAALYATLASSRISLAQGKQSGSKGEDLQKDLPADVHRLKIGDAAPDFSLKGVDGKTWSLADFKDAPVLMVAFLSNHCPYSHASETRLLPLVAEMKDKGLAVVAINPNSPEAVGVGELGYSKYNN